MSSRVGIYAHVKFKITRFSLNNHIKVTRFKITIKDKRFCAQSHRFQMRISFNIRIHTNEGALYLTLCLL